MLHIFNSLKSGHTVGKNVCSRLVLGKMCSSIERCVFRASLYGAHFLLKGEEFMDNIYEQEKRELEKKAKDLYNEMKREEIVSVANRESSRTKLIGFIVAIWLWITAIIMSIQPFISESNMADVGLFIGLAIVYALCGIVAYIVALHLSKKPNEILVLNSIKRKLKKQKNQVVEEQNKPDIIISKEIPILANEKIPCKLLIDNEHKQFVYAKNGIYSKTYNFSDLIDYEIYENNKKTIQGRAGSALVGGVLFGVGGAIIGGSRKREISKSCTQLKLIIYLNDLERPQIVVDYEIANSNQSILFRYKMRENLQNVRSVLEYILNAKTISENNSVLQEDSSTSKSNKERLQELKEMLDDGLITQEDFEQKKKQILGL